MNNSWLRAIAAHPLSRLVAYYIAMTGVIIVGKRYVPGFEEAISAGFPTSTTTNPLTPVSNPALAPHALRDLSFSMIGAFFIIIPVAWVYVLTKLEIGYDESVVHTMIILPLSVAGIVVLVQDSLPLAFSLAGIVAAVRFRSTLDDTKDAVYVFVAIAIGLAAGVQALPVALLMSLIFNSVILLLWRFNIGNIYSDRLVLRPNTGASETLGAPTPDTPVLSVGDPQLLAAMSAEELSTVATRLAHLEKYITASADKPNRRFDAVILVHANGVEPAQRKAEPLLTEETQMWRLAEITPGQDGTSTLEYLVRMHDDAMPGALLDHLREVGGSDIVAAEYKSLKALRKKKQKK